ncbi:MAG: type I restriction enzyme HsdR N-terminal domain-containing protein [Ghiorsea sp.]
MDFIDRIKDIASRMPNQLDKVKTEEATKNAFIMPFISSLGYDVFNPSEVIPEFTADVGTKKGEKVDYAIKKDEKIIILIECKWSGSDLNKEHASQLHRYFAVTEARFAVLTNGVEYRFYTDIDAPNVMDKKPFFTFNILDFEDHKIEELKKFTKSAFSLEDILTTASTLKYTNAIKKVLAKEIEEPSEQFVRFFLSHIHDGRITQPIVEEFTGVVKVAANQFVNELIGKRFNNAMEAAKSDGASPVNTEEGAGQDNENGIVTTQDELDAFQIVRAISREVIDVSRVMMRDTKSYCGVLLDDNNRKPICRLHFNYNQKYIGILDGKNEERIAIDSLEDIFSHADKIKATISNYE